jgi:hypothetical protein
MGNNKIQLSALYDQTALLHYSTKKSKLEREKEK